MSVSVEEKQNVVIVEEVIERVETPAATVIETDTSGSIVVREVEAAVLEVPVETVVVQTETEYQSFTEVITGPQGIQGVQGEPGVSDVPGPTGPTGPAGPTGPKGDQGEIGPMGPQGEVGPAGAIGPEGMDFRGVWQVGTAYAIDDAVSYEGSTFIATQANTGTEPDPALENGPPWAVISMQGDVGPPGPTGPQGAQGIPGPSGPEGPQGEQGEQGIQGTPGDEHVFVGLTEPAHPPYDLWVNTFDDPPTLWVFV